MSENLLQFARGFEKIKVEQANLPTDLALLLLIHLWKEIKPHQSESMFQSYIDEFCSLIYTHIDFKILDDFYPDELANLRQMILEVMPLTQNKRFHHDFNQFQVNLSRQLIKSYFNIGDFDKALDLLSQLTGEAQLECDNIPPECDARELLEIVYQNIPDAKTESRRIISEIRAEWDRATDEQFSDRVLCLFVEKNNHGGQGRGRMRWLRGSVEQFGKNVKTDEVTFDNQIKTPDDPFIGAVYDSLSAIKTIWQGRDLKTRHAGCYHAHFSILEGNHHFSGDSIGLAAALIAFVQLRDKEIYRIKRQTTGEVAITGTVDEDGCITAVNPDSLPEKIRRAFYSHVKYLVLPQENLDQAQALLKKLQTDYPRRHLRLIGVESLRDVLDDPRILGKSIVCPGEYFARKTAKYSRSVKVQVPLLLILIYILLCQPFPKLWIGFDWNPQYVKLTKTGFVALNIDSVDLWEISYDCEDLQPNSAWDIGDIDKDGANEIAFSPCAPDTSPCDSAAMLYVYDDNGELMFVRSGIIYNQYPGDESYLHSYNIGSIRITEWDGVIRIITQVSESMPSRTHLRFWSGAGDSLGWYVNAGPAFMFDYCFSNALEEGFLFFGVNRREFCVSLFVLPRDSCKGVSPPYINSDIPELINVKRGNQLSYLLFPQTDLGQVHHSMQNHQEYLSFQSDSCVRVDVREGIPELACVVFYYFDANLRIIRAALSDEYVLLRDSLITAGILKPSDRSNYLNSLRDAVTYWTDSGWVTEGELRAAESKQ